MFRNLEPTVETFQIETLSPSYLVRAVLKPLGNLPVFLNDRRRNYLSFEQAELQPFSAGRQMTVQKQEMMSVSKEGLLLVALTEPEEVERVRVMASKRPVVFYLGSFAVRGYLHITPDASDQDLLDEARDFYPVSDASIFPLETVAAAPTRQVPLLFLNRPHVQVYHVHRE